TAPLSRPVAPAAGVRRKVGERFAAERSRLRGDRGLRRPRGALDDVERLRREALHADRRVEVRQVPIRGADVALLVRDAVRPRRDGLLTHLDDDLFAAEVGGMALERVE